MNWIKLLNNNRLRQSTRSNREDARNDFESDFGRIIFSPAIRRMHDKTQVFPLTTDDNIHSRLTHSLEVMSVGYSLGVKACESEALRERIEKTDYELFREIPIILKNCCLVHDIGNPPFGHFGETVIQEYFSNFFTSDRAKNLNLTESEIRDFTEFDGNAQGLRILTKLQILNDSYGLNLTFASLASYIKYPNCTLKNDNKIETKKRGVFQSEKEYFEIIANECGLIIKDDIIRHPLCYLMEAADSICYLAMDIEDGYNKKIYDFKYLCDELKTIRSIEKKINEIKDDPQNKYRNEITKVVNFRIHIIQTLVNLAAKNFEENIGKIENGTYNKELIDDDDSGLVEKLKAMTKQKIFKYREIVSLEVSGNYVITGLLNYYIDFVFHKNSRYREKAELLISNSIIRASVEENILNIYEKRLNEFKSNEKKQKEFDLLDLKLKELKVKGIDVKNAIDKKAKENLETEYFGIDKEVREIVKPCLFDLNDYYKLRIITDYITGMTDQFALNHFQKISGQKIN